MSALVDGHVARIVRGDLPALYLLLDASGRVIESNRHTRELIGRALENVPFTDLLVEFQRDLAPARLAREGGGPHPVNVVTFVGLPQTYLCWFAVAGETTVVVGGTDPREQEAARRDLLTAHQALTAAGRDLTRTNAELARAGALKDQFVGMAAHDLRSPLMAVSAFGELLSEELGPALDPGHREALDTIRESADLMRRIVDGFLDAALISAGRLRIDAAPAPLAAVVERAAAIVSPAARRKRIALALDTAAAPPPFPMDGPKVTQVVVNLLANAVQHSPEGARVAVTVEVDGPWARVRVRDHGSGIPPEIQRDLFAAYARGEGGKTAGERSIGLGLAISRLVVEAHGGAIGFEPCEGPGTAVAFRLPLGGTA